MTPDLKVKLGSVELNNPIMTASGCCGYGEELAQAFPLSRLGALVTKSITREPRLGHPSPRTVEAASGMLNAIGLANVGLDCFISDKVPFLEKQDTTIVVNVAGSSIGDYVEVCARLNDVPRVDMIEVNISCPNVKEGGIEIGTDPTMTEKTIAEVRRVFSRPIIAKLTPNVTDISVVARAAEAGGADILSLINTLVGTSIDFNTWRPRLTNNRGGLSGPAIKPVALAAVDRVYQSTNLPLIGIGGIASAMDVVEFMLVGATAVQIGTSLFKDPQGPVNIVRDLKEYLKQRNLSSVTKLIGQVRKY
ncbi:MAG: dihydroorotate dehydrogenase [candidate division Zixibacteria bacterium]|nr:dihydroorotate dehydrogenase [candidate division Zixibacteria bacterium]